MIIIKSFSVGKKCVSLVKNVIAIDLRENDNTPS